MAATATIVGINHDFRTKKSHVLLVWDDEADKRLSLPVPFGCSFEDLPAETDKAVRALSAETAALVIKPTE
ncbi:hypothetical protein FF80_01179 [Devosia sp. LC5]|uniref:hypothetical protein n=1 Tax=Devosia sp. LC5 TaxID=1502724 RepID=UPI0004E29F1B|nr:hypothetical protein [Devosia sp. LC5]KFC69978.1 hypothetical protein FF80_01179 [Devosia sp. LC5]